MGRNFISWALQKGATLLAQISKYDFDVILRDVIEIDHKDIPGAEKAKEVANSFLSRFPDRAKWVAQTLTQIAYAIAAIKGLVHAVSPIVAAFTANKK